MRHVLTLLVGVLLLLMVAAHCDSDGSSRYVSEENTQKCYEAAQYDVYGTESHRLRTGFRTSTFHHCMSDMPIDASKLPK